MSYREEKEMIAFGAFVAVMLLIIVASCALGSLAHESPNGTVAVASIDLVGESIPTIATEPASYAKRFGCFILAAVVLLATIVVFAMIVNEFGFFGYFFWGESFMKNGLEICLALLAITFSSNE